MASEGGTSTVELSSNLVESLQVDFKNLSSESKKKYPQVKEVNTNSFKGFCMVLCIAWSCRHLRRQLESLRTQVPSKIMFMLLLIK